MKSHTWILLPALALAVCAPAAEESLVSPPFPAERYRALWEKSPFTLASAEEMPVNSFAENYAIAAISTVGDQPYVRIYDRMSQNRFTVSKDQPAGGIELIEVTPHRDPMQASVRIQRGGEIGEIRYDPNMLQSGARAVAAVPTQGAIPPGQIDTAQPGVEQPPQRPQRRRQIILPRTTNN